MTNCFSKVAVSFYIIMDEGCSFTKLLPAPGGYFSLGHFHRNAWCVIVSLNPKTNIKHLIFFGPLSSLSLLAALSR